MSAHRNTHRIDRQERERSPCTQCKAPRGPARVGLWVSGGGRLLLAGSGCGRWRRRPGPAYCCYTRLVWAQCGACRGAVL